MRCLANQESCVYDSQMEFLVPPPLVQSENPLLLRLQNRLRLKHFWLLRALGDHHNLHLAAAALSITQPSATKLLKDVEQTLGLALFTRHSRGLEPTPLGAEVVSYARLLLGQMGHFGADLDSKRHGGHGFLSVGAILGAVPDLVAQALAAIKARYPLLTIRVLGDTSDQLMQLMAGHQLEVAVCRISAVEQSPQYHFEPLGNEALMFVVGAKHHRVQQPPASLAELLGEPWVVQPLPSPSRVLWEQEFSAHNLPRPGNVIECSSVFASLQVVEHTHGVALLPEPVARDALRAGRLVALQLSHRIALNEFGLVYRRGAQLSAPAQEFIRTLRRLAAREPAAGTWPA